MVLWLIDHPCKLKQLQKLSGFNYIRCAARSLPCLRILALMTGVCELIVQHQPGQHA